MELRERVVPGLKEKLKAHYQTKEKIFQPDPTSANKFGVTFFLYMSFVLLVEALYLLVPDLQSSWNTTLVIFILFVFVQSMLNWLLTIKLQSVVVASMRNTSDTDARTLKTPVGWRTCVKCQLDAPPRSHHCNLCGVCVLKRDHHCFFTASCVGFHNQRRFIVLLFYTVIANAMATVLQFLFLNQRMKFLSREIFSYIPFVTAYRCFITHELSLSTVFVVFHLLLTMFCLVGAVFFLCLQISVTCQGQTTHEAWENIGTYQTGILTGLRSVFGPHGFVHFLFPFQISLKEDGINWDHAKRSKSN